MSFEIKKIYTDNPYVDEIVYYSKLLGMNTVLKMQQLADNSETAESVRNADLYIACMEGTAIFELFPRVTATALRAAGITNSELIKRCLSNKDNVPSNKRESVTRYMIEDFINNYEELNPYYRMLHGLPAIGREDYVEDWMPPDGVIIDLSKPIHLMTESEISLLKQYGVLDDMIEEDPVNRQYMKHLVDKKIDYYTARKASRFDPLYIPSIDSDAIYKMYRDKLDANKLYVLRTVYSEAFNYNSDYYDNFIAVLIVMMTIVDIISRVQEFIARKEIFDIRSVQYIFKSNGVPFYEDIPLKYQIAMVKNLHTLLKYKSTKKCMVDICKLFGFDNIKIFKYYLLRDRKIDLTTGEYIYSLDENGNEDLTAEYELKFLKLPLEDDLDSNVKNGDYISYNEITSMDPMWDGGLDHDIVMSSILEQEFNFVRTKYISIDTVYDIAKMAIQQTYFFNLLYDNISLESMLTVSVPFISSNKSFNIAHIFTFLTLLSYYYNGVKDTIMDTASKVLYVEGFNFKADLALLAQDIANARGTVSSDVIDDANTQLNKFDIPNSTIPSINDMLAIYVNNLEVRDELIKGMQTANDKQTYDVYKKLYDSLMTTQLTLDYYKNPDTGDFYRDEEGDATYTEFLKNTDATLYALILEVQNFEDQASRNEYIANVMDSIIWALEEYISADEFQGIYANLPVVSTEVVKTYMATVINFYKSYKIDFLGINTIYTLDDKTNGIIKLNDDIELGKFMYTYENISVHHEYTSINNSLNTRDSLGFADRIWIYPSMDDYMNKLDPTDSGKVVLADSEGDSAAGSYIIEEITGSTNNIVTELAAVNFIDGASISSDNIVHSGELASTLDEASDTKIVSERAAIEALTVHIL